jgi:Icc-related predicted phosphoesterase
VRAALVVAAAMVMGCRSTKAATTTTTEVPDGAWSCGAVHGGARLSRTLGHGGRLALGVVADTNGTAAATMANLSRLAGVFSKEHVDAVLALGDLGADEGEIATVLTALGRQAGAPVLALAGERAPEGVFHAAVARARQAGIDVVDLVDTRLVDTGEIDIVSLPGYPFSPKGCHYTTADLDGAERLVAGRTHPRVVAAHTPPKGDGAAAADWALGGINAGDPAMARILDRLAPRAAVFAHVDEAGGRADGERINVGAVERGMAAIVTVDDGGGATHRVLR